MAKILIVDDLQENLYYLEVLLKTNGFEIQPAHNGAEALESARRDPPDLIVSDVLMPVMDGFTLCRQCKSSETLSHIPFIFYTATYTDARDEKLALELGADRFIVKPIEADAMLAIIEDVLAAHKENDQPALLASAEGEEIFYKEYNEALIRKLEDKMMELQKSNKRLRTLYQVSSSMQTLKTPDELIHDSLENMVKSAGYYQACYYQYNEEMKILTLTTMVGQPSGEIPDDQENAVFRLWQEKGLVGMVAAMGRPVNIADTSKEPNWLKSNQQIKSALFTPVHFKRSLLGIITIFSDRTNAFSEEDQNDITTLANNLAIMIENSRNQEQVKKQLTRVSALHTIDMAINNSIDLSETMRIFLDFVTSLLNVDAADVLVCGRHGNRCEKFLAGRGFKTKKIQDDSIRKPSSLNEKVIRERVPVQVFRPEIEDVTPEFMRMWSAEKFQSYYGTPLIARDEVMGVLEIFHRGPLGNDADWVKFLETLAGQAAIAIHNYNMLDDLQQSNTELYRAYDATIEGWSRAMDLRDHETEGHTQRVTDLILRFARLMEFEEDQFIHIRRGALLHDIGKLGVPDAILLKPGPLTEDEWFLMRKHPEFARDMLLPIEYLRPALDIPLNHHEKWDGSGYPNGLKGEEIPLIARMFSIIDVWDALRSDRPYRKAVSDEETRRYIREQSGLSFEPRLVEKFFELVGN